MIVIRGCWETNRPLFPRKFSLFRLCPWVPGTWFWWLCIHFRHRLPCFDGSFRHLQNQQAHRFLKFLKTTTSFYHYLTHLSCSQILNFQMAIDSVADYQGYLATMSTFEILRNYQHPGFISSNLKYFHQLAVHGSTTITFKCQPHEKLDESECRHLL